LAEAKLPNDDKLHPPQSDNTLIQEVVADLPHPNEAKAMAGFPAPIGSSIHRKMKNQPLILRRENRFRTKEKEYL
jgi:hypothetical protein